MIDGYIELFLDDCMFMVLIRMICDWEGDLFLKDL